MVDGVENLTKRSNFLGKVVKAALTKKPDFESKIWFLRLLKWRNWVELTEYGRTDGIMAELTELGRTEVVDGVENLTKRSNFLGKVVKAALTKKPDFESKIWFLRLLKWRNMGLMGRKFDKKSKR